MVGVSSRFISETELAARPSSDTTEYDPRSLFEQLQAHKHAKDAELDDKFKLSNQFRGLDQDESDFLAQANAQKRHDESQRVQRENEELQAFRAAKAKQPPAPPRSGSTPGPGNTAPGGKKDSQLKEAKAEIDQAHKSKLDAATKGTTAPKKRKATSTLGVVKKKPAKASPSDSHSGKVQPDQKSMS